ncbi:MAG: stage II sporulation protein D [Oscillospiraceae bacterium]|jgi:stage II sporulation protein D|nr:stage II sporulation protein D [Oscillospiraceae bacterium]
MKKVYLLSALLSALAVILTIVASVRDAPQDAASAREEPPAAQETPAPDAVSGAERDGTPPVGDADTTIRVLMDGDVVTMALDEYLAGAVAGEMPAAFEREALRAQAVAARTLALYRLEVEPNSRHPDADVCTDPGCCMAYAAGTPDKIIDAVRSTDGIYAAYEDEPILAAFHSSSAGKTEDSGSVWGGELPYLVSVPSPETPEQNEKYTAVVTTPPEEFRGAVTAAYPDAVLDGDASRWITDVSYTRSGRIAALTVGGVEITGTHLRAMFGLGSTAAEITAGEDGIVFVTKGHGHGVGMSQYGANAMAAAGAGFGDILRAYYTGITLRSRQNPREAVYQRETTPTASRDIRPDA